jgi:hypothetical protein
MWPEAVLAFCEVAHHEVDGVAGHGHEGHAVDVGAGEARFGGEAEPAAVVLDDVRGGWREG